MSTPAGLLRWGQSGRYSAFDDRVVITALAGGRTGVIRPAGMVAGLGLTIVVAGGWCAVGDCGDGTVAVLAGTMPAEVVVAPGGSAERTDELVAEIIDPETARWSLSVVPSGARLGVVLGWVHVPPGATSAAEMTLESREQDFSTGGAIPGPPGPMGPQGAVGPPGQATLIVGTFGAIRTPEELPPDGFIPANWDGPGRPDVDTQVMMGWSLIYSPSGDLWTFVGSLVLTGVIDSRFADFGAPWLNVGMIQGPPGAQGPAGPQGAPGQPGAPGVTYPLVLARAVSPDSNFPATPVGTSETTLLTVGPASGIPLAAGRLYRVVVPAATFIPSTANTQLIMRLRYTTNLNLPTVASAQLRQRVQGIPSTANWTTSQFEAVVAGNGLPWRFGVFGYVQAGTFQFQTGGGTPTLEMRVEDLGPAP